MSLLIATKRWPLSPVLLESYMLWHQPCSFGAFSYLVVRVRTVALVLISLYSTCLMSVLNSKQNTFECDETVDLWSLFYLMFSAISLVGRWASWNQSLASAPYILPIHSNPQAQTLCTHRQRIHVQPVNETVYNTTFYVRDSSILLLSSGFVVDGKCISLPPFHFKSCYTILLMCQVHANPLAF